MTTEANPNPNPSTKLHAVGTIQLNIITMSNTYPDKFIRDKAVYLFISM